MSDNKYYEKIRKYARRALNSDLKTYIRGRDLYMYGTVNMSEYVKQSVFDDTIEELEGKIQDLDDKKADKSDVYTKDETDDKFLTKDDASKTYQPKGDYITKDEASDEYQPKGDYATVTYVDNADAILLNQINLKQDILIPGSNITIVDNVISATGGGGGSGIDKISASGTSPLKLSASVSGTSATITGSVNVATNDTLGVVSVKDENGLHIIDDEYASNNGEIYLTLVSATENGAISAEDKMRLDELWEDYIRRKSVEYDVPVVELSYPNVPNGGGTSSPIINYSLTWRIEGVEQTPITSGAELKYELVENLNPNYYTVNVDESTGKVTATATSVSHELAIDLCNVKVTVTLNGKSGEDTAVVVVSNKETTYTESLTILTFEYNNGEIIPATGGTYSPTLVVVYTKTNDNTGEIVKEEVVVPDTAYYSIMTSSTLNEGFSLQSTLTGVLDIEASEHSTSASVDMRVGVTYTSDDGTLLSTSKTITVTRAGKDPEIEYSLEATLQYNGGSHIPKEGGPYRGEVTAQLITMVNGVETGRDTVTPDSTFYTMEPTEWAKLENESTGLINWEENPDSGSRNIVVGVDVYYTAPNGEELKAEAGGQVFQDGQEPEIKYELEITEFSYPPQSYTYEAHDRINASNLTVMFNTYQGKVLIDSVEVTSECDFDYTPNVDWITIPSLHMARELLPINIAENTTTEQREGTVHLVATYQGYEAEADSNTILQGAGPEKEYKLEITEFNYPAVGYNYMAHENIDVSSLTVMFNTYQNKVLIDSTDVTNDCTFLITPNVDWITLPTVSLRNSTMISITENTTTEQREGTVHLVATYGEYTAEADSNTILQGAGPDEYSYSLNVANFQYHTSAGTNVIPVDGCTDEKPDLAVLLMTVNTSTGYTTGTLVTPTSSYYTITNGGSIDSSTGAITISSNIATTAKTYTVTGEFKYIAPNGEELEASKSVTLTQSAPEITYSLEISSFSYNGGNNIPAEGGPFYPDLVVSLNTTQGAKSSASRVTPDSTFYTMEYTEWADLENEGTGLVTWDENTDSHSRSIVFNVQAWYTAPNGEELTAEGGNIIYQDGVDTVVTYKNPEIDSLTYPSMPASGGTISPIITYHQDWSDNKGNSGTITNTGAEFSYWFIMSLVNCTIDKSTGDLTTSVVNSSTNTVVVGDVQCFITMNGLNSSTHGITVYQEGAEKTTEYEKPIIDLLEYPTIPSSGGTISPSKLTYHQDWKSNDGTSGTITNEGGTFTFSYVKDQVAGTINSSTGALTVSTENSSTDMITAGSVSCAVTMNGITSTNYNVDVYQQGDNPDDPLIYYLAQGNLIINSEATGISASNIDWENVSVNIYSNNNTGTGLKDVIYYRPMGESELLISKFGSDIPLLPTHDNVELTKVAKLSMIGISFEDPTLNLDDKQIKYTFKWHYNNNKTFERSGNLYLENRGMGDTGLWLTDDYDQSDANLYYNADYEMYPEVTLTITD